MTSLRTITAPAAALAVDTGDAGLFTTLTGLVVPYDTPTDVGPFIETIARGTFAASLAATPNVPLHLFHGDMPGVSPATPWPIGVATGWDDRPDGLHGVWRLGTGAGAQDAARMVRDGILTGLSIRFMADELASFRTRGVRGGKDQVRQTKARLVSVSLTSVPAYPSALVTGVRATAADRDRAAADEVVCLALDLGDPRVHAAVTGSAADMSTACNLVWTAVATHGATGARQVLEDLAVGICHTQPGLALNLTRAASCLNRDRVTAQLRDAHVDQWRALLPPATDTTATPPARRRRRR